MSVIPYLCCDGAAAAIDFYRTALGAEEVQRWTGPDGRIGHAELLVEGHRVFLADEHPEIGVRSPRSLGGTPVSLVLTVADADTAVERALAAGATLDRPVTDAHGSRAGWIFDPFGHRWNLQTPTGEPTTGQLQDEAGDAYQIT
jgi:PhnB protein